MKKLRSSVRLMVMCAVACAAALGADVRPTRAQLGPNLSRAEDSITEMDFDDAHRELDGADTSDQRVAREAARLALYETRFDDAVTLMSRPDVARMDGTSQVAEVARGCARVAAATIVERDEDRGIELRFQDENDRALAPLMLETIDRARAALERDLGVSWPRPMRVLVVRDLLSLAVTTGLPYDSARTTGTVAVAKWGRVTLLSPRASKHGYAWRDTIAHELTHLAVTRLTTDRAPLWLQEGIAKREEIRWRDPGPFDDRPTPESVVARGMAQHLDVPLDHMGPSIAMLPSADRATVAFAEVLSFVRFYADTVGPSALPNLLGAIRVRDDANAALLELTGADLAGWDAKWRAYLSTLHPDALPETWALGGPPRGLRDIQDRARLAELLLGRDHPGDAVTELEPLEAAAWQDPSLRHLRGLAFEAAGSGAVVEASLGEPKDVAGPFGPWWAIRGRFARIRGDEPTAEGYFQEGVANDPLDVEAACETLDAASSPAAPALGAAAELCEAARQRGEPRVGRE
jgi:hypothetical protein